MPQKASVYENMAMETEPIPGLKMFPKRFFVVTQPQIILNDASGIKCL